MRTTLFTLALLLGLGLAGCGDQGGSSGDTASDESVPTAGDENVKVSEGETEVQVVGPGGEPADLPPPPE